MRAGALKERVAFDEPTGTTDAFGGTTEAWTERHVCAAQWMHSKGDEQVQAAREAGRSAYKIVVRSCEATRAITAGYRMRDTRRGLPSGVTGDTLPGNRWNITDVDAISDRRWVYLVVEGVTP
jgi:head-tail adaptor